MAQNVPLFLTYIEQDSNAHICVGISPKSLCGSEKITSATQAQDIEDLVKRLDDVQVCDNCEEMFNEIRDDIRSEPTIRCHRCNHTYSSQLARQITHRDAGSVEVCRPCYKELYESSESGVDVPYDEKEPFYDTNGSRKYDGKYS